MSLPGVSYILGNGSIGSVATADDRVGGMIMTGQTVAGPDKVTIGNAYQIFSLDDAIALGIEESGVNAYPYIQIKDFYTEAGSGKELWIMLTSSLVTMAEMYDETDVYGPKLRDAAGGRIRLMAASRKSAPGITIADGLDEDVYDAMINGQVFASSSADNFKPFRFLVDGKDWNGTVADLRDYSLETKNRGGVLIGASELTGANAAIGLLMGRWAGTPVQRKASRVKTGDVGLAAAYFTDESTTETFENSWDAIHDKGYIFFRTFGGKAGYFFTSDRTGTSTADDYSSFARGFVIDKAIMIAYQVYVNEIDDEISVDASGAILPIVLKELQGKVENAINIQMVSKGELDGFTAFIDPNQNVVATGILKIKLRPQPVGYKTNIEIDMGYFNPANS